MDHESKVKVESHFEKFVNAIGKYKIVATAGYEKFGKATGMYHCFSISSGFPESTFLTGMPAELISKMVNDVDSRFEIDEVEGFLHCKSDNKASPLDVVFNFDEEYNVTFPVMPNINFTVSCCYYLDSFWVSQ